MPAQHSTPPKVGEEAPADREAAVSPTEASQACSDAAEKEVQPAAPLPSLFLEALATALIDCGDGKPWYVSTTQLQLASLDFLVACRAVPLLHLTVDGPMRAPSGGSRLPAFRPRGITWNPPTWALRGGDDVFADVKVLVLGHGLSPARKSANRWVDDFALPPALEDLTFSQFFDRPIHRIRWPASLTRITFGEGFNQPLDRVRWPASLRAISFGEGFNQPVDRVRWPAASLREISFGDRFNQPIGGVPWPLSLEKLSFGRDFGQTIDGVSWPPCLRHVTFFSRAFQAPIDHVDWPGSLERLTIARPPGSPLPSWPGVEVDAVWRFWWVPLN